MEMIPRSAVALLLFVLGSFVAAVLIGMNSDAGRVEAILLLVSGVTAVAFAKPLTEAQHHLAEKRFVPHSWGSTRPLLFVLWGLGVSILGAMQWFDQ